MVGTGGANHTSIASVMANSQVRNSDTYGVLRLTLHPTSYDWQFVPEVGKTFTDSGTGQCHGLQSDTTPPTAPTDLSGTATGPGAVNLTWTASTDAVGVLGYRVFRGGTQIGTATGTAYTDTTATPATTASYAVAAYDAGGNQSALSTPVLVTTPPDTTPPTRPTGLTAQQVSADQVRIAWAASSDDVAVAQYAVLRDGTEIGTSTTPSYTDGTVEPTTSYTYRVVARDAAGNSSDPSDPLTVLTPALPQVITLAPTDDSYVRSDQPAGSFGADPTVQVDGSPLKRMFLKFAVTGLAGRPVSRAVLRLQATDSSDSGGRFHRVSSTSWSEGTLTWGNQPAFDPAIVASLGSVVAGGTYEVDLTGVVTGDGTFSLAVDSASSNGADFVSAEGAAGGGPTLVITAG